jgi:N-methylhydantoinase A/oxoprolinase/acetone carboxylase beta subunit
MSLVMGIDTGGTCTDGVVIDPSTEEILDISKVPTTLGNVMDGIQNCIGVIKSEYLKEVTLVCLSTTLATNAVIEDRGGTVGLLCIGKIPDRPPQTNFIRLLQGRTDIKGKTDEGVNREEVYSAAEEIMRKGLQAVAVSGFASVRNPEHELLVKEYLREKIDLPVACGHELTCSLGFAERTTTTVLNARLISIVRDLIDSVKAVIEKSGINAHLMIVKGDGSLVEDSYALERPIETILSGPAVSITGGIFLSKVKNAIICDMGGTTTDIGVVKKGQASLSSEGATIGGHVTYIRAADICTFGIGGDSYIRANLYGHITVGPERVIPLSFAGQDYPHLLQEIKDLHREHQHELFREQETDCYILRSTENSFALNDLDKKVIDILEKKPHTRYFLADACKKNAENLNLRRLVQQGLIACISLTPTDVLHTTGDYTPWNAEIAKTALLIMADKIGYSLHETINKINKAITEKLLYSLLQSILHFEHGETLSEISRKTGFEYYFSKIIKKEHNSLFHNNVHLDRPLVTIGAPAAQWIPKLADYVEAEIIVPKYAEVANAVGAAIGQVSETDEIIIRPNKNQNVYILHAPWERKEFSTRIEATEYAVPAIKEYVSKKMTQHGSLEFNIFIKTEDIYTDYTQTTMKASDRVYVETQIRASAIGKPKYIEDN